MSGLLLVRVVKINRLIIRADSPPLISDRASTRGMIWVRACVCVFIVKPSGYYLVCVCDWLRVGSGG